MPTYRLTAINVGSFPLGEADKVVTLFSKERGLSKAVAKGARKPGAKMAGKSEALCANKLLLATGRSLDIITQAESLETYAELRTDLHRLSYGLYYAELTRSFGEGIEAESEEYYDILCRSLRLQADGKSDAQQLCLQFEMTLLMVLGLQPELQVCVHCRSPLTEYSIKAFLADTGGVCCDKCYQKLKRRPPNLVAEGRSISNEDAFQYEEIDREFADYGVFITPNVWKSLVLASSKAESFLAGANGNPHGHHEIEGMPNRAQELSPAEASALSATRRITQRYLEDRAGRRMKALDLLKQV